MKPADLTQTLRTIIRRQRETGKIARPLIVRGAPGIGKSDIVRQAAAAEACALYDVRAALRGPMDILGMPVVDDEPATRYKRPDIMPPADCGPCVWFLDELDKAPPLTQNALLGGIHDREIHGHRLPPEVIIVAAMNRAEDQAHSQRMSTALLSRFRQVSLEIDLDDWTAHMLQKGARVEVVAFCRFVPGALHDFNPRSTDPAFASPRTHEMVSDILDEQHAPVAEAEQILGTIGQGRGAEFLGFLRVWRQLPTIESVILAPGTAPVPDEPSALYAICGALASKTTESNFASVARYLDRLPADFSVLAMSLVCKRVPGVQASREFVLWATKHKDILF